MDSSGPEFIRSYLQGRQVVSIEQPLSILHLIDGHVVLIENKHGVMVNGEVTRHLCDLLEQRIVGDYSWVINRKADYSIDLVETYGELNSRVRLKKIALVSYRKLTNTIAAIEQNLYQKEFSIFTDLEEAIAWAGRQGGDPISFRSSSLPPEKC
jgi:hypothetical protein